jgi:hypothetical protein
MNYLFLYIFQSSNSSESALIVKTNTSVAANTISFIPLGSTLYNLN